MNIIIIDQSSSALSNKSHRGHVPVADGSYISHQIVPGHHTLHVDMGVVPEGQDILV